MFNGIYKLKHLRNAFIALALLPQAAFSVTPLFDLGFESGTFGGWQPGGNNGGTAAIAVEGECFSVTDTTGIDLPGNYAAFIRSVGADANSFGTLTSPTFNAGIGVSFRALTERIPGKKVPVMPVDFAVNILGSEGAVLKSVGLQTAVVDLNVGCLGDPANGAFSTHFVSTREFEGQQIRIQFKQGTKTPGRGYFTLVDELTRFDNGDRQVLPYRPVAVAGVSENNAGTLRLDGSISSDPGALALQYEWRVRNDLFIREGEFPCIGDLETGNHQATLTVNNGLYTDTDEIVFVITESVTSTGYDSSTNDFTDDSADKDSAFTLDCSDSSTDDTSTTDSVDSTNDSNNSMDNSDPGDDSFRQNTPRLSTTAVVWKPISESNGKLVVLTPTSFGTPGIRLFNGSGILIEEGDYVGHTNGNRATYRFNRPGAAYQSPVFIQIGNDNYRVDSAANRVN